MPTTLTDIEGFLYHAELRYQKHPQVADAILTGFDTANYTNSRGEKNITLVVELSEEGRYISIFAPQAFTVSGEHTGAFLHTCAIIQFGTKLIQFEYDQRDGEVRPKVEFPLEDSALTQAQLLRCIRGLVQIVDLEYERLARAASDGTIPDAIGPMAQLSNGLDEALGAMPEAVRRDLLRRLQRLQGGDDRPGGDEEA